MDISLARIAQLLNVPLVHIGQVPVTLGGILSGILVFCASFLISALVQRALSVRLARKMKLTLGMTYALKKILHYVIVTLGILLAIQCVGLNLGSLAVIFGFISVGIGFGLQNITSNFISGIILLIERPVSVDDFVSIEGQIGRVKKISMRSTDILTLDNISIIVPNSKFIENSVTNWSYGDPRIRLHCPVGVAYGSDIPKVKEVLMSVAQAHKDVLAKPEPEVRFVQFGSSSLDFDLLVWIDEPEKQFLLHSQINYAIDAAFREAGITIPFPQTDVHVQLTPAIEKLAEKTAR